MMPVRGYDDPAFKRDPTVCGRCGHGQFTIIPEPGVRRWYCAHCAASFKNEYAPVEIRCEKCRIKKPMQRWDTSETTTQTQRVCDDCEQRGSHARAAWNQYMGRS